jgi:hypothetical protein
LTLVSRVQLREIDSTGVVIDNDTVVRLQLNATLWEDINQAFVEHRKSHLSACENSRQ